VNAFLNIPNNDHLLPEAEKSYGHNCVFDITLSYGELTAINIALKERLACYTGSNNIEDAHPSSHIGMLNALRKQIEDAQHGRRCNGHRFNVHVIGVRS
jgi:hypothetical protein